MNDTPPIDKGIPIPEKYGRGAHESVLRRMKCGDSVKVNEEAARTNLLRIARTIRIKVTSRKLDGEGYRVWRVK